MKKIRFLLFPLLALLISCNHSGNKSEKANLPVAQMLSDAKTADGMYISWKEHLIDGLDVSGVPLSGSDGLEMADLDKDGYMDIVSVHEADTAYDGLPRGYIRIAYGTDDPDKWDLVTLSEGAEAAAPEDVAIGDMNGDGWPDILIACELAHLIYFQNPVKEIRTSQWPRLIPQMTVGRGSFIRVFCADFDGDGQMEVTAPNKGNQNPRLGTPDKHPICWYKISGDPLDEENWTEHELNRVKIPENARPVDLDGDGDLDILGGSRGEERIFWFENLGRSPLEFREHPIDLRKNGEPYPVSGVMVDFEDFNKDGRLDIAVMESPGKSNFGWIEQPENLDDVWNFTPIGTIFPDHMMGLVISDINGDGNPDFMTGAYSASSRVSDDDRTVDDVLGRLAWFEHPGDPYNEWIRHDFSRRIRSMYDQFVPLDMDKDGDIDFVTTRGNSFPYDGVLWLEQVRTAEPSPRFVPARKSESRNMGLPTK